MKLSTRARYGIRAMIEITLHGNGRPVDLNEISKKQGLSKKYLHALLVQLKNAGLLASVRGNAGGYLLAKSPKEINLLKIFEALEGSVELVDCVARGQVCSRAGDCIARAFWARLSLVIRNELSSTTLADLMEESKEQARGCYEI